MARKSNSIAEAVGATAIAHVSKTGGGAFGAARLARVIADLQQQLTPGRGKRPGRPTKSGWNRRPKVPMSRETERRLIALARKASTPKRRVSPMQLAGRLLEEALANMPFE